MANTILGIDIGSTRICALIADERNGDVSVIGSGISKSQGIKKGLVTNIELTSKAIKNAVNDAKRVAGTNFSKAIVSVSGAYVKGINSSGVVNIPGNEVTIKEINRVLQTAIYNANILSEYEVIHVLPYNFKLDEQNFIDDPLGMNGSRLEVFTHIITAQKTNLSNLKKAVTGAGIDIENFVLNGYASSIAVLDEDDKELGVAVINFGGATCNLVVHSLNSIKYNDFLAVGSYNVTNDISQIFHTPLSIAEKIKKDFVNVDADIDEDDEQILELPVIGDENSNQDILLSDINSVVRARVEETLLILAKKLEDNFDNIGAGIILTGGMTKLQGIKELASEVFDGFPVKIAKSRDVRGVFDPHKDQDYSTAIGLILYGAGRSTTYEIDSNRALHSKTAKIKDINLDEQSNLHTKKEIKEPKTPIFEELQESNSRMIENYPNTDNSSSKITKFWQWVTHLF